MSKRNLEKRIENLEAPEDWEDYTITIGNGPENLESPEGSIAEDLRENLAEKLGKEPEEIEIEDKENTISELVSRIAESMEETFEWESADNELSPEEIEGPNETGGPQEKPKPELKPDPEEKEEPEEEEPEKEAEEKESLVIEWPETKIEKYDRNPRQRPRNAKQAAPEAFKKG